MNVVFHTLTSVGITHVAARALPPEPAPSGRALPLPRGSFAVVLAAFVAGVLSHGILDGLKHGYPIHYELDPPLGLVSIAIWCVCARPRYRLLGLVAFLGAILPDLVDLGPGVVRALVGGRLPHPSGHLFPWHWHDGSGSLYPGRGLDSGDNQIVSITNHLIVVGLSLLAIAFNRAPFRFAAPDR
jgi:hypothetical protein